MISSSHLRIGRGGNVPLVSNGVGSGPKDLCILLSESLIPNVRGLANLEINTFLPKSRKISFSGRGFLIRRLTRKD
jgi:hypothetical protein